MGLRSTSAATRTAWTAVLALVLALRLLTPVGFMPTFDGGRLAIVECPGSDPAPMPPMAPMSGMHHDQGKTCQSCPHATATGAGLLDAGPMAFAALAPTAAMEVLGRAFPVTARTRDHYLPPAIGPPLPV